MSFTNTGGFVWKNVISPYIQHNVASKKDSETKEYEKEYIAQTPEYFQPPTFQNYSPPPPPDFSLIPYYDSSAQASKEANAMYHYSPPEPQPTIKPYRKYLPQIQFLPQPQFEKKPLPPQSVPYLKPSSSPPLPEPVPLAVPVPVLALPPAPTINEILEHTTPVPIETPMLLPYVTPTLSIATETILNKPIVSMGETQVPVQEQPSTRKSKKKKRIDFEKADLKDFQVHVQHVEKHTPGINPVPDDESMKKRVYSLKRKYFRDEETSEIFRERLKRQRNENAAQGGNRRLYQAKQKEKEYKEYQNRMKEKAYEEYQNRKKEKEMQKLQEIQDRKRKIIEVYDEMEENSRMRMVAQKAKKMREAWVLQGKQQNSVINEFNVDKQFRYHYKGKRM